MRSPRKAKDPGRNRALADQILALPSDTHPSTEDRHDQRELVVVGVHMPPDQRRHLPGAWVSPCPGCGLAHTFRGIVQGSTVTRVPPCRTRMRVHVAAPNWYGLDGDDDWWADDDGNVLRGNQQWIERAA